jgi:threonine dehydrogenase-like Zn-dependent dehydrogenase
MKTKSFAYLDQGGIELVEYEVPDPGPSEVQVHGGACGICAWDLYTYTHGAKAPYAAPPGHEGIGYVAQVGHGVTGFKEGDRVTGGGFATVRNVPADSAYLIPNSDLADAYWTVEPVSCVVTGVDHTQLRLGDRLAVIGCGYMGLMLIQCLANSFAEALVCIDIVPERLELAREYGASQVLNASAGDLDAQIAHIADLGIDTVIDTTGSQAGLEMSAKLARRGGRILQFGWVHGNPSFPADLWHLRGYTVINAAPASKLRDTFPVAVRLIDQGVVRLEKLVTHVVSLDELDDLLARVTAKEEPGYIKGVVTL